MNDSTVVNDEFVAFWNDVLVAKFERFRNILLEGLSYHSQAPLGDWKLPQGSRVVDVGCGWGDTAIALARKVGPSGSVLGLDCCDAFLDKGRDDARAEGLDNVRFVAADVQTYPFKPEYDACFSRFGMMFFANPVAAMRNIRRGLKPGGRLLFVVWRQLADNPFLAVPKEIVLRFLPPPGEDAQTCGPGPFSMANPDVVTAQLEAAGYDDIAFVRNDGPVMVGRDVDQAVQFQLALGPAGEIVREAGALAQTRSADIDAALREALARHRQTDGSIVMHSSSWAITARNPAP
ncbi:MAG TPA: class I SAM-dependent methyltransferase [Casimicrobiaceae bacterium]|nr:class I SAM-dependent methyltransferase [Casimicrobiaceae bacterium]